MSIKKGKLGYWSALIYLFRFIKPYIYLFSGASIIALLLVGTGILHTINTQILVDSSITGDKKLITQALILFAFLLVINISSNYISSRWVVKLSTKTSMDIKQHICKLLLNAKYGSVVMLKSGDILSTINSDTQVVSDFIATDMIGLFAQFTMAIGAISYLFFVNPLLAVITFVYTPIGMFFTLFITQKMNKLYPLNADYRGEALSIFEQALMQIPIIKSFMMEKHMLKRIKSKYQTIYKIQRKISFWEALLQPACSMVVQMPRILYLAYAGLLVMKGNMSVGAFIAIFELLNYIIGPTVYFPFMLNRLNKTIASINRIKKLETVPLITPSHKIQKADNPEVKISNMEFSYCKENTVFSNFSFHHKGSGIVSICGESGSGKTTLLDLITGLYAPISGSIFVNGYVSVVTQEPFLFRQTVYENIQIVKRNATSQEVYAAIKSAGAEEFIGLLSKGYETILGDGNDILSGGQKQRLSLARALLADHSILLLDEPTSALDAETEQIIVNVIKELSKNKLIMIAAHRQSLKDIADVVVNLDAFNFNMEGE